MTDEIRRRLHATPFVPFQIRVADGREYEVASADHAQVSPKGGRVSVWTDEDQHYLLPALLISGIAAASTNGDE
ncbi:hypothetical protein BH20VER1_BH20VER1_14050 [soil metagenome]